jgi:hypothetical protein
MSSRGTIAFSHLTGIPFIGHQEEHLRASNLDESNNIRA